MLVEESIWISEKIKEILPTYPFPVLNVGSSTLKYRTVTQPFIQTNIFSLFDDEKNQVIHLDMKKEEGIDMVGDLSNESFRNTIKSLKPKLILCNNVLMYLNKETRKKLAGILYEILDKNGYLIVTNSHVFPPAHDPLEAYYRASPVKMKSDLFNNFVQIDSQIIETQYSFYNFLKLKKRIIPIKILRLLLPLYRSNEWWFMLKYYFFHLKKNYSASCLFLKKE